MEEAKLIFNMATFEGGFSGNEELTNSSEEGNDEEPPARALDLRPLAVVRQLPALLQTQLRKRNILSYIER